MSETTDHTTGQDRPEQPTDDGEEALGADIAQFTTIERNGPWLLAYLVARRVLPGDGDGVGFEQQSTKCFDRYPGRRKAVCDGA